MDLKISREMWPKWQTVRTLGELQILSRASYAILFVVPLLAGIWPAVRIAVNSYNDAVTQSRIALESAAERLGHAAAAAEAPARVDAVVEKLRQQLDAIIRDYAPKTLENPRLPSVWAIAFFASLAITIAQLIYQSRAPALVRKQAIREYVAAEVRRFAETPSREHLKRSQELARENNYAFAYAGDTAAESLLFKKVDPKEVIRRGEIALIEQGAAQTYHALAGSNPKSAAASAGFYALGVSLIIWITCTQTLSVFSATWGT